MSKSAKIALGLAFCAGLVTAGAVVAQQRPAAPVPAVRPAVAASAPSPAKVGLGREAHPAEVAA
ncbi:MAG: hypothetical protein ACRCVA_01810, partial [Phreatobacter sp.]